NAPITRPNASTTAMKTARKDMAPPLQGDRGSRVSETSSQVFARLLRPGTAASRVPDPGTPGPGRSFSTRDLGGGHCAESTTHQGRLTKSAHPGERQHRPHSRQTPSPVLEMPGKTPFFSLSAIISGILPPTRRPQAHSLQKPRWPLESKTTAPGN